MGNLLRQYYQGITQQLRSEVDFINSLFEHQGVKGEGNEAALRELLKKFIPTRYGVGTGVVIDRHGKPSRQCDIIVYDIFLYPSLLALTSIHLFPVDLVYATIEVKTTLNAQTAKEALENIASVRRLDYIQAEFVDQELDGTDLVEGFRKTEPPIGVIFAYNSEARQCDTFKNWFTPDNDQDTPMYPSLICCLDMGIVSFGPEKAPETVSVTSTNPEIGMKPKCLTFPVARKKDTSQGEVKSKDDVQVLTVRSPAENQQYLTYEGSNYPIKKIDKDYRAIDQGRTLLIFLLHLADLLAHKKIHPDISFMNTYMEALDRFRYVC
jgi:hypothetical protein